MQYHELVVRVRNEARTAPYVAAGLIALALALEPRAASAQTTTTEELLRRIDVLEAQLAELKVLVKGQPKAEAAPAEAPDLDFLHDLKYGGSLDL
jgi:hypothetical protein